MRHRQSIMTKGFVYGVCVAALLPLGALRAQGPTPTSQMPAGSVAAPKPPETAIPAPLSPIRAAVPPAMEEREDPFSPSPTDAERRAEDDRRVRELVQPMINQMRDAISQGMGAQIEQNMQKAIEGMKRPEASLQTGPAGTTAGAPGMTKARRDRPTSSEEKQEDEAEARAEDLYAKAKMLIEDPDPKKQALGRAMLEQYDRGAMPRWSSGSGVYFIGCVNKKRMYRDKFGDVFTSEFWFDGSAGANNTTGGTGVTQTTAARQAQRTASGSSSGQGSAMGVDPCAD